MTQDYDIERRLGPNVGMVPYIKQTPAPVSGGRGIGGVVERGVSRIPAVPGGFPLRQFLQGPDDPLIKQAGLPLIPIATGLAALFGGAGLFAGLGAGLQSWLGSQAVAPGAVAPGGAPVGGAQMTMGLQQYGIRGPGVPEPAPGTVMREWSVVVNSNTYGTFRIYYFRMFDGYTLLYNPSTKVWKRWKPRKNIVLSSDPRLSQIRKAERAVFGKLKSLAKKSDFLAVQKRTRTVTREREGRERPHAVHEHH